MRLNNYVKRMDEAFEIALSVARKKDKFHGYIRGYLDGALQHIKSCAIEDNEISGYDFDDLITYAKELSRRFDDESKSI